MDDFKAASAIPAALVGLVLGGLGGTAIGYAAHAMFTEPEVVIPPPQQIQAQLSDEELAQICADLTAEEKDQVKKAHAKVQDLQGQLESREKEMSDMKKRQEAGAAGYKKLQEEVANLRVQLAEAQQERDTALAELKETVKQMEVEIREKEKAQKLAARYKEESTENLWSAFGANAKVEICDRGTRKRHAKCHEAVDAAMAPFQERFRTCVDSFQAVPVLRQAEKKNDPLPAFSTWVNEDDKFTKKGWYVIFCDTSLPEGELAGDDEPL